MTQEPHATSPEHEIQSIEPDVSIYPVTVFHQGYGNDGGLWCNTNVRFLKPLTTPWKGDTLVPSAACLGSPSAVYFQGNLLVFSTSGLSSDINPLYLNTYHNTRKWSNQTWWLGVIGSPSAVIFNNMVYILFAKHVSDHAEPTLHYATYDGTNLAGPFEVVPRSLMQNSPGACQWGGMLYVFFQTPGNYQLWFKRFDGLNWDTASPVPGPHGRTVEISGSPACTAIPLGLFVCYQGIDSTLKYNIMTNTWLGESTVPNTGITGTPCPAYMWGNLYVFHQGNNADGQLWYNTMTLDGNWEGDRRVPDTGMSASPAVLEAFFP